MNSSDMEEYAQTATEEIADEQTATEEAEIEHRKPKLESRLGGLGVLLVLLFKFKGIILLVLAKAKFLLIPLKYLKVGQVFTTMGSMLVSVAVDAMLWGWWFAAGFVALLFVHEMGHVVALRAKGIKASAPIFIPFMGAVIGLKEMPHDAKSEAEVGIAGPLLGTLGAFVCLQIGHLTGMQLLVRLAYVGFFLNLFNLLPVLPLDGGRVMAAISPKVWLAGMVLAVLLFIWSHSPIFLILVVMSVGRMWHTIRSKPEDLDYYNVPREVRIRMTLLYFGLAAYLGVMLMQLRHP